MCVEHTEIISPYYRSLVLTDMCIVCVQFAEKFAEYKEAARLAKEKSQEKMEMATSPSQVGPHSRRDLHSKAHCV